MPTYRTVAPEIARTPTRTPGLRADNGVPFTSALISGGMIATAAACTIGGMALYATYRSGGDLLDTGLGVLVGSAVVFSVVATVDWFRQRRLYHETIWARETATGEDHDGDGQIGRPRAHGMTVNTHTSADPEELMTDKTDRMLQAIYEKQSTLHGSIKKLCPDIDREDYEEIRDQLIKIGVARWIGSGRSHGWKMTAVPLERARSEARKRIVWLPSPSPTAE